MNSSKTFFKNALTKGDIILIVFICFLVVLLFLPSFISSDEKLNAHIYLDGEVVKTVSLSSVLADEEITVGGCRLLLQKDGVSFVHSECKDKLCIKKGKLRRKGDTMACVPEKVVVTVRGESKENFDIATY